MNFWGHPDPLPPPGQIRPTPSRGTPPYTEILTSGGACNLANNHSHDYGADSYTDTKPPFRARTHHLRLRQSRRPWRSSRVKGGPGEVYELAKLEGCAEDLEAAMADVKAQGAGRSSWSPSTGALSGTTCPTRPRSSLAHRAVDLEAPAL